MSKSLCIPDYTADRIIDIKPEFFQKAGISGVILDIDDTLVPHGGSVLNPGIKNWITKLKSFGMKFIIVSNDYKIRVKNLAGELDLEYINMGLKPLPGAINKAVKILGISKNRVVIIGDQIFADIIGAHLAGIRSVLVEPASKSKTLLLKIKRFFEKPFRKRIRGNPNLRVENI